MKLINNAGQWHRLWSVRFILLTALFSAIIAAYNNLPSDWLPLLPGWLKKGIALADLASAGLAGLSRVIKQESLNG